MLHGLNKKPRKKLQVQYYLKTAGFDMLVIFHFLRTWKIKLCQYKNYIYCQLMRHYDVTDSMQMCADTTFAC